MSNALLKSEMHSAIAESVYNEIVSGSSNYYHFFGETLAWSNELSPPVPIDSKSYSYKVRDEIITAKKITSPDVSYVIPRYDWTINTVYDQYDDTYSTEIQGINIISGGSNYVTSPYIYIGDTGYIFWQQTYSVTVGQLIKANSNYYIVSISGTTGTSIPTHTSGTAVDGGATLQYVNVYNNNGTGATASATITGNSITSITMTNNGYGYTDIPSIIVAGGGGSGANLLPIMTIGQYNGAQKLEDAIFYVVTDEYNVYVCIDNNNGALSTRRPFGTSVETITLSDGYTWKFMYNIPLSMRSKFTTNAYIPVLSALTNQYYSNGNIQYVNVDTQGSGYNSATISVSGDGYIKSDPLYIIGTNITAVGSGYASAPSITFDPPFTGATVWTSSAIYIVGELISYNNNIYKVVIAGICASAPTHTYGIVLIDTLGLEYVGTIATATTTISSGNLNTIVLQQMVRQLDIISGGSGYTSAPSVSFSSGTANAVAILQNGSVINFVINNTGANYTTVPTVTIGTQWQATTAYTTNQQIFYSNRLYTVTSGGTSGSVAPTHTTGSASNGSITLLYAGVSATATCSLKCGAGYSKTPIITIFGNATATAITTKSEARLVPVISNHSISMVQIIDGGIGYTYAKLTVNGDGADAAISANLYPGSVDSIQANVELLTVAGTIMNIPIISGGYGYTTANIAISGDGTGCVATPTIVGGAITKISISSPGYGYTWATVTITGNGHGASARCIMSPVGGHGKNALKELNAKTLMLYTSMSNDLNQGFTVSNDYRQIGILKNPKQYNSIYNFTNNLASACWSISSTINPSYFPVDSIITMAPHSLRFRIVAVATNSILLQSLDNGVPVFGSVFTNGYSFVANTVTSPTIDKFSGEVLYVDNKQAFMPSSDQIITIRSVFQY